MIVPFQPAKLFRSALFVSIGLLAVSCSKDDDAEPAPSTGGGGSSNNNAANTTPAFPGADGALFAVSTATTQEIPFFGSIQVDMYTGVAVFYDAADAPIAAGEVRCNDSLFTYQNNAYYFQPSMTNITGLNFSSGVVWDVTGGNGIPAFTRNTSAIQFPVVDTVSSATTINRSADYTLTVPSVYDADSVYFTVGGLLKRMGPNSNQCTFTAAELGTLGAGPSIVQVAAFNYYPEDISGKTIYFGKERVITRSVTLQ